MKRQQAIPPNSGITRIQLDLTPKALARLEEIKGLAGTDSNASAIRNALRLYAWYLEVKQKSGNVFAKVGEETEEVDFRY